MNLRSEGFVVFSFSWMITLNGSKEVGCSITFSKTSLLLFFLSLAGEILLLGRD